MCTREGGDLFQDLPFTITENILSLRGGGGKEGGEEDEGGEEGLCQAPECHSQPLLAKEDTLCLLKSMLF